MSERALSLKQAFNCEMALEARCRCRCNGQAHGRRRSVVELWDEEPATLRIIAEDLAALAPADPHYIQPAIEHPLGPMRRVTQQKAQDYGWRPKHQRGTWKLTLECGHTVERKLSRRPPKQLHCAACKGLPAVDGICSKCRVSLSKHTKSTIDGWTKYYCLRIPASGSRTKRLVRRKSRSGSATPRGAHKRKKPLPAGIGPGSAWAKKIAEIRTSASRSSRKRPGRSR